MPEFIKVAEKSELEPGTAKKVEVGGQDVALFNIDGTFYALNDMCPHRGQPGVQSRLFSGHQKNHVSGTGAHLVG